MTLPTLIELGAGAAALLALGALVGGIIRVGKRAGGWLLAEFDERLDVRLSPINNELRTNGGSSLRDAVNRIEKMSQDTTGDVAGVKVAMFALERRVETIEKQGDATLVARHKVGERE